MNSHAKLISQLNSLTDGLPTPLQREINAIAHKITNPMVDILAKVPGDSLTERAKRLKVSRQTMYVWMSEKFRPTRMQAKRISKYTDVPIELIVDDGWEASERDVRRKARQKAARVATRRKEASERLAGAKPKRRRKVDAGSGESAA